MVETKKIIYNLFPEKLCDTLAFAHSYSLPLKT